MAKSKSTVIALLLIVGILFLIGKTRAAAVTSYETAMTSDERYYLPPSSWMKLMCLGYNEAAADLVWLKTVVYFGGRFAQRRGDTANHTANYLLTAVDLNPEVRTFYLTGAALTMFQNSGQVSEATVKMAMALLERGIEAFPDDGEIHFALGFYHYYEMRPFMPRDHEDPKRKFHNEIGTKYIRESALMENAPDYAAALSTSLQVEHGMADVTIQHLKNLLLQETDPEIRNVLMIGLRAELGKAAERDILESDKLVKKWKEDLPYVPFRFYLLLQPEVSLDETLDPLHQTNQILGLSQDSDGSLVQDTDGSP